MIFVNGVANASVGAEDRGLAYGDGVFRTLLVRSGAPRWWLEHYRKLEHDCGVLSISCPAEAQLRRDVDMLAQREPDCVVKIIVTRGTGERGYAPGASPRVTRIVMSFPLPAHPPEFSRSGVTVRVCSLRIADQPALAGIKHLNRLENVLARAEWRDPGIAEGLLLDGLGNVIGGTMSNLFIVEEGCLITPGLARAGVAGVARDRLIAAAARHGVSCRADNITIDRILQCREAFLTNSVIRTWPIRSLGDETLKHARMAHEARRWLDEEDR